jgi:hypothetical protein
MFQCDLAGVRPEPAARLADMAVVLDEPAPAQPRQGR